MHMIMIILCPRGQFSLLTPQIRRKLCISQLVAKLSSFSIISCIYFFFQITPTEFLLHDENHISLMLTHVVLKTEETKLLAVQTNYSTRHTFWYSLMMIPSIPLLADPYVCFACLSWCWLSWCWSWLKVGQCWLYTD